MTSYRLDPDLSTKGHWLERFQVGRSIMHIRKIVESGHATINTTGRARQGKRFSSPPTLSVLWRSSGSYGLRMSTRKASKSSPGT